MRCCSVVVLLYSTCACLGQPSSAFDPADSSVLEPPLADISLRRAASPAGIVSAEKPPAGCGPEQAQICNFLDAFGNSAESSSFAPFFASLRFARSRRAGGISLRRAPFRFASRLTLLDSCHASTRSDESHLVSSLRFVIALASSPQLVPHLSCACFFFSGAHPASRCSVTEVV